MVVGTRYGTWWPLYGRCEVGWLQPLQLWLSAGISLVAPVLNAFTGKCKHFMPNAHRGWMGHCSNNQQLLKKYATIDSKLSQCEDWFGGTATYTVVSELDDPTWPCIECLLKTVSDFVGERSWVHIMPISAKWKHKSSIHIGFIVFNGGVTTFLPRVYVYWWTTKRQMVAIWGNPLYG